MIMKKTSSLHLARRTAAAACCLLALAACERRPPTPGANAQWVAKVDDHEITVHQVNAELSAAGAVGLATDSPVAQRRAVEALVDRRVLVDAAMKEDLHRDPEVVQAIEKAREQIVAQAYLRKVVGQPVKPTQAEIDDYFEKHPALFAQRKQYDMRHILVDNAHFDDEMKALVNRAPSLDEVERALAAKNTGFSLQHSTPTGADLPPAIRDNIDALVGGKPFVIRTASGVLVVALTYVKDTPLSRSEASAEITDQLTGARVRQAIAAEVERLRRQARVDYQDGYGPAAGRKASANAASAHIEQGVAGLR